MVRCILHVGYGKTGTTALQSFLAANRDRLARNGILYPDFKHSGTALNVVSHNMIGMALDGRRGWLKLPVEAYFAQIDEQVRRNPKLETVILSAETFLNLPQPFRFASEDDYWQAAEAKVARLASLLAGRPCLVVMYVRRQDDWLEASLNQTIKFARLTQDPPATSNEGYLEAMAPRLDYHRQASLWTRHFGKDGVKVLVYDRGTMLGGDIVTDFLARVGIPDGTSYERPAADGASTNERMSRDVLEYKRIMNRIERSKEDERALAFDLIALTRAMARADDRDAPLYAAAERQRLMERYSDSNRRLASDFLGTMPPGWTTPAAAEAPPPEVAYPGLPIVTALEIHHRLAERRLAAGQRSQRMELARLLRTRLPRLHALLRVPRRIFGA